MLLDSEGCCVKEALRDHGFDDIFVLIEETQTLCRQIDPQTVGPGAIGPDRLS